MTTPTPGGASVPTASRGYAGAVIGERYTLQTPIGAGGMGAVWHAHDNLLRRDVAVKEVLLPPGIPPSEQQAAYERTLVEARAAAGLSHPSVVRVYDVVTDNGRPWIVMELLQARSLADIIREDGPLPVRALTKVGLAVLGALEAAHKAGVLHRDVKPANVLICSDGRCVLTDFGVARIMDGTAGLTTPGMVLGSPQYMSPERAVGSAFGPPSDLFSLGVTLYTAAEGRPPFDRGDPLATMHAVVYEEAEPVRRAPELAPVLAGLMHKDPHARWDVSRVRNELRTVLSGTAATGSITAVTVPVSTPPGPVSGSPAFGNPVSGGPVSGGPASGGPVSGGPTSGAGYRGGPDRTMIAPAGEPFQRGSAHVQAPLPDSGPPSYGRMPGVPGSRRHPGNRRRLGPLLFGLGAAVIALILVIVGVGTAAGWFDGNSDPGARTASNHLPDGQPYTDNRGFTVSVPKGWKQKPNSETDFLDPQHEDAWIRFNVENSTQNPENFLESAGRSLSGNRNYSNYQQLGAVRGKEPLAGQQGAQLEYKITENDNQQVRHALWRAVIVNGRAYQVYMSVPDTLFDQEKPNFELAVQTFKLAG